jgi:hypothetical protein
VSDNGKPTVTHLQVRSRLAHTVMRRRKKEWHQLDWKDVNQKVKKMQEDIVRVKRDFKD